MIRDERYAAFVLGMFVATLLNGCMAVFRTKCTPTKTTYYASA